jgi:hypothetical protein
MANMLLLMTENCRSKMEEPASVPKVRPFYQDLLGGIHKNTLT